MKRLSNLTHESISVFNLSNILREENLSDSVRSLQDLKNKVLNSFSSNPFFINYLTAESEDDLELHRDLSLFNVFRHRNLVRFNFVDNQIELGHKDGSACVLKQYVKENRIVVDKLKNDRLGQVVCALDLYGFVEGPYYQSNEENIRELVAEVKQVKLYDTDLESNDVVNRLKSKTNLELKKFPG